VKYLAIVLVLSFPSSALAWVSYGQCNGSHVRWASPDVVFSGHNPSIIGPERNAVASAVERWDWTLGTRVNPSLSFTDDPRAGYADANGVNAIYSVGVSPLCGIVSGAPACTITYTTGCSPAGNFITEADTWYRWSHNWIYYNGEPDRSNPSSLIGAMIHEIGHALGLDHHWQGVVSYMREGAPNIELGGSMTWYPMGDDIIGIRAIYGTSGVETGTDLFLSNRRTAPVGWIGTNWNNTQYQQPITIERCRYESFPLQYTVGNLGPTTLTGIETIRFYYSTSQYFNETYPTFNMTPQLPVLPLGSWEQLTSTLTVPGGMTPGTLYYIGAIVDPDNSRGESTMRRQNNSLRLNVRLQVLPASSCP
jgi:hypothetical protein